MTEFKLYHYDPSFILAVIFIALFSVSALSHLFQLGRSKTFFFIPFFIGCVFEAIGYAGRAISAKQTPDWAVMPYAMQSLLLLLGPTMLAASIYMTLGRLIVFLDADFYSLVPIQNLTKVFVIGDVLSFLAQSGGGGMLSQAKTAGDQKTGQNIIIFGLAVQLYFFAFFITVLHVFHRRINKNPTKKSLSVTTPWKRLILVLYIASGLIMVRSIFRIVEYITGSNGPLQSTEIYIYVFDAALMCITTALFNVFHPGRVILPPKGPEIFDNYDDSTSIPLQSTSERVHQVTETVPSPPIQYKRRSTASLTPVQYNRQSYTQSPPLQYNRQSYTQSPPLQYNRQSYTQSLPIQYHLQSQRSFTPMQQQAQVYRPLNSPMGSMSDMNRMPGAYNHYASN